ncbi:YciI family protein [Allonocardiopsis opalescens]|uniref:YCII-related domain-containing protein n=1 Tax=Allonocardiopsis opalescens TaxID=1144618 RepID=A0A2T0PYX2_9ACTN|nr:YciI family protein [Allonocardiopsis opalescens]PRX96718.1 hypothetical protein CLV72_107241 [Allonocardiopsis opalescens]
MKYLIATYGSQRDHDALSGREGGPPAASAEEPAAIGGFLAEFTAALADSGELVDAQGLAAPALARRVRLQEGARVVTDGPFAETEEVLAGYWIVECADLERATEIAARLNECPGPVPEAGTVIWPVLGADGGLDD